MIKKSALKKLPRKTGVYLMRDAAGNVLYVGKALDLRRRVSSYFGNRGPFPQLSRAVAPKAADIDYIVTDTEKEALLLENTLIKEHRPRYNVHLRDDKTYAHIQISVNDDYPRLTMVRRPVKDGGRCFGPYSSSEAARTTIRFLQRLFRLRDCSMAEFSRRRRPCIKYQIKRCCAPCCAMVEKGEYRERVRRATLLLSGREHTLLRILEAEMREEAAQLNFEKAGEIRNIVAAIRRTVERQKCVSPDGADRDALGLYREGGRGEAAILCVRGGRLIGRKTVSVTSASGDDSLLVRDILLSHYLGGAFIPPEILLPSMPEDREAVEMLLSKERRGRLRLLMPRRGDKRALVRMACANAEAVFQSRRERDAETAAAREAMRERFKLPAVPKVIECVDISNLAGAEAVGSLVVFRDGVPVRNAYRRFSIKTVGGSDDCGMIYEVINRRARRGVREEGLPDLIMVDGGRGQLGAALRALRDAGVEETSVIAIAKERGSGRGAGTDRVFIEGRKDPLPLREGETISLLLQRIRNEAHRVALWYHRESRSKRLRHSVLRNVRGIGEKRASLLLRELGGIEAVARVSRDRLKKILGNDAVATRVHRYLRQERKRGRAARG